MDKTLYERWRSGDYAFPGGFELRMFQAFEHAGADNQERLKNCYPELFSKPELPKMGTIREDYRPIELKVQLPFRPGDGIWVLHENRVKSTVVDAVTLTVIATDTESDDPHGDLDTDGYAYQTEFGDFMVAYPTKEALLASL